MKLPTTVLSPIILTNLKELRICIRVVDDLLSRNGHNVHTPGFGRLSRSAASDRGGTWQGGTGQRMATL